MINHIASMIIKANSGFDVLGHASRIVKIGDEYKLTMTKVSFYNTEEEVKIIRGKLDDSGNRCDFEDGIITLGCGDIECHIKHTDASGSFILVIEKCN